jgi:hypothetical protein
MEGTLEAAASRGPGGRRLALRDRFGAWLYTGAPGRLLSFSVDLALSLAALALYLVRKAWRRIRGVQSPAA